MKRDLVHLKVLYWGFGYLYGGNRVHRRGAGREPPDIARLLGNRHLEEEEVGCSKEEAAEGASVRWTGRKLSGLLWTGAELVLWRGPEKVPIRGIHTTGAEADPEAG